ncbi:MAG: hypothetical protein ACM3X7_13565 [Solirubrobacterales bacterium]
MGGKKYIFVLTVFFITVTFGILTVTSTMPKAIKDNSSYKINFNIYPFNFEFSNEKYKISAGRDTLSTAKNEIENVKNAFIDAVESLTKPVK